MTLRSRLRAVAGAAALTALAPAVAHASWDFFIIGQHQLVAEPFCPENARQADGSLMSIRGNEALFSLLGCRYGGDCRTNFALPDMRGRTTAGAYLANPAPGFALGNVGGEPAPLAMAHMPAHTHQLRASPEDPESDSPQGHYLATPLSRPAYAASGTSMRTMSAQSLSTAGAGAILSPGYSPVTAVTHCIIVNGLYPSRN